MVGKSKRHKEQTTSYEIMGMGGERSGVESGESVIAPWVHTIPPHCPY